MAETGGQCLVLPVDRILTVMRLLVSFQLTELYRSSIAGYQSLYSIANTFLTVSYSSCKYFDLGTAALYVCQAQVN